MVDEPIDETLLDEDEDEEQPVEYPKKKKGAWGWIKPIIVLGIITFIVVAPIATIYICFWDGTAKETEKDPSFDGKNFLQDKLVSALDTTKDDGQIAIKVSEADFNQMLLYGSDEVKKNLPSVAKYLVGADLQAGDTQYVWSVNAHLGKIFKTRARAYTALKSEVIDGEDCLVFQIDDVKMGRVSFYKTFKKNKLLKLLINDNTANELLKGFGFSIVSDIEQNNRFYYPKSAISKDISIFNSEEGEGSIYTTLIDEFYHQNMFTLDFNSAGFAGGIDLTSAHDNTEFVSPEKANSVDFIQIRDYVQNVLNAGIPSEHANLLYKFYIVGYNKLSDEEKAEMEGFDLSDPNYGGIADVHTYEGVIIDYAGSETVPGKIVRPQVTIESYVSTQADASPCDPGDVIATIEEHELNKTLMSSDVIGTPRVFVHALKDGTYKVNTFSINNMYANIYNNTVKFAVDLSINGYDTYICLNTTLSNSDTFVMNFNIDNVYYGEMNSSDAFRDQLLNLLFESFGDSGSGSTIGFDRENRRFTVDVASSVSSAKKDKIELAGGVDQIVTGTTKDDDGTLIFQVKNS